MGILYGDWKMLKNGVKKDKYFIRWINERSFGYDLVPTELDIMTVFHKLITPELRVMRREKIVLGVGDIMGIRLSWK